MMEGFLILVILLLVLFLIYLFTSRKKQKLGWEIKKIGNSKIQYQERDARGTWRSLSFEIEMYSEKAPRHILFAPKNWTEFPSWAHGRKEEILATMKSKLKEPRYTYLEVD
jgi:hypothetical protein